jgi:hypothetical protein
MGAWRLDLAVALWSCFGLLLWPVPGARAATAGAVQGSWAWNSLTLPLCKFPLACCAALRLVAQVRKEKSEIDMAILREAMDKVRLGLPHTSLPDTPAKRR